MTTAPVTIKSSVRPATAAGWPLRLGLFLIAVAAMFLVVARERSSTAPAVTFWSFVVVLVASVPTAVTIVSAYRTASPTLMLNAFYYAFTIGFFAHRDLQNDRFVVSDETTVEALQLTAAGVAVQYACYLLALRLLPRREPLRFTAGMAGWQLQFLGWVLLLFRLTQIVVPSLADVPSLGQFIGVAGSVGLAVLYACWLRGELPWYQAAVVFGAVMPLELAMRLSTGALTQPMLIGLLIVLVHWVVKNKIAWIVIVVVFSVYLLFAPLKLEYRRLTGEMTVDKGLIPLTTTDKVFIFLGLAEQHWLRGLPVASEEMVESSSIDRFAILHLFTLVVYKTPGAVPYWDGETLGHAVYTFIPRAVWADKPNLAYGNDFGQRYGLLDAGDFTTSVNLPWVVELYANFGGLGVVLGMAVIGVAFALLEWRLSGPHAVTMDRVIGIALTFTLCFPESNIVVMWGGIFLSIVTIYLCCRLMATLRLLPEHHRA